MVRWFATTVCLIGMSHAVSASPLDDSIDRYLTVWADNTRVTPLTVAQFYARSVDYYGKQMTNGAVFRDKMSYVTQWPSRLYDVVPGSVGETCDARQTRCRVTAILRWSKADAALGRVDRGANTMTLDLVREDGELKIARESGTPVVSASCNGTGARRICAGFR